LSVVVKDTTIGAVTLGSIVDKYTIALVIVGASVINKVPAVPLKSRSFVDADELQHTMNVEAFATLML
jgi:hypothetical protein